MLIREVKHPPQCKHTDQLYPAHVGQSDKTAVLEFSILHKVSAFLAHSLESTKVGLNGGWADSGLSFRLGQVAMTSGVR